MSPDEARTRARYLLDKVRPLLPESTDLDLMATDMMDLGRKPVPDGAALLVKRLSGSIDHWLDYTGGKPIPVAALGKALAGLLPPGPDPADIDEAIEAFATRPLRPM